MTDNSSKVSKEVYEAFSLFKEGKFDQAKSILERDLEKKDPNSEPIACALLHSTLGVLHRMKGDNKEAWRNYQKAEKLMPDDPALKILMARFMIDEFAQYGSAIRKAKKVLKIADKMPSFEHQARTTIGLAYLKKGNKKKAIQALELIYEIGFEAMISSENIDFTLVEALSHRNLEKELCERYMQKAEAFARAKNEPKVVGFIQKLKESLEPTVASN